MTPSLVLDATDANSYNTSTTQWYDLSGNNYHVNKSNLTWSSSGSGSYYYNNVSTDFYVPELATSTMKTIEMWVKVSAFNSGMFFGFCSYDVWTGDGHIGYNSGNSDVYGISSTPVNSIGILNNLKHFVFVMSSTNYTLNKIYINGVSQVLSQQLSIQNTNSVSLNNGCGRISGLRNSTGFSSMNFDLSTFIIYPFEVSSASITQKFNQEKSKYGL